MSTNYPGGLDSYTDKVDGVDTVVAATTNNIQDAIEAIEVALGTLPYGSYTDIKAALNGRLEKSGGAMTGDLDMGTNQVTNLGDPTADDDAANKAYVDDQWMVTARLLFQDDFYADKSPLWTPSGTGGSYVQNAELGGTGDLSTGATANNESTLTFNGKGCVDRSKAPVVISRARLSATTQLKAVLAGLYKDDSNLIEIYYDVTTPAGNFMYRCKSGGTETTADSNLAADTSYHVFRMAVTSSQVVFTIDGANQQTISTNLPTALLEPMLEVITKEASDKRLTVDYYQLKADR